VLVAPIEVVEEEKEEKKKEKRKKLIKKSSGIRPRKLRVYCYIVRQEEKERERKAVERLITYYYILEKETFRISRRTVKNNTFIKCCQCWCLKSHGKWL